jgi:hypothetical protein
MTEEFGMKRDEKSQGEREREREREKKNTLIVLYSC